MTQNLIPPVSVLSNFPNVARDKTWREFEREMYGIPHTLYGKPILTADSKRTGDEVLKVSKSSYWDLSLVTNPVEFQNAILKYCQEKISTDHSVDLFFMPALDRDGNGVMGRVSLSLSINQINVEEQMVKFSEFLDYCLPDSAFPAQGQSKPRSLE